MSSFEVAWDSIAKAPFVERGNPHTKRFQNLDYVYSGGHADDEPSYWTEDILTALGYALFGSAIPRKHYSDMFFETHEDDFKRTIGGMRETVPTIWRIKQPPQDIEIGFYPDKASDALRDPELDFVPDEYQPTKMSDQEVKDLIINNVLARDGQGHMNLRLVEDMTTGAFFPLDDVLEHSRKALERLETKVPGRLDLPFEALPFASTSFTDDHGYEHYDHEY